MKYTHVIISHRLCAADGAAMRHVLTACGCAHWLTAYQQRDPLEHSLRETLTVYVGRLESWKEAELVKYVTQQQWEFPLEVQVFVKRHDEAKFSNRV